MLERPVFSILLELMAKLNKTKKHFLNDGLNLPKLEEQVLEFWKERQIFQKSLDKRKGKKPFVFYEGPPTANGRPGIHHVLARAFKDIILRYKTMRGFYVPRKAGWDTHGLPVEIEVEKKLGLRSKKDIEKFGIAEFNQKCRESVWEYKDEWEKLTDRMGYWLDMKHPYVTYHVPYMESLWWTIAQFYKKGLMYKGHKVVPWCTRCGTALSSHELGQPGGYKEVTDNSVYLKFKLSKGDNIYILSWTTTPWTLPGNVALAVGEDIKYIEVEMLENDETWILAEERLSILEEGTYRRKRTYTGKNLVDWEYEPLFNIPSLKNDKAYKIYAAPFVTTTDGTGVVHTAVMYGEDDYQLGVKEGLPQVHTVDEAGRFIEELKDLAGTYAKSKEAEDKIFEHLRVQNNIFRIEPYKHEYPHCWRCSTPLLYYARSSWFVSTKKVKAKLLAANKKINWTPEHLKAGRFGEWLKDVKDWNFSRERYWGTPLPIWECEDCNNFEALDGLASLQKRVGPLEVKNSYLIMRHGQAENNVLDIHSDELDGLPLTKKGQSQAKAAAKKLKKEGVDLIVSSDMLRAKETANILSDELGVEVKFDERLREMKAGIFSGRPSKEYHNLFPPEEKFEKAPPGGENFREVRARVWKTFQDLEKKHKGKKILIVSHDHVLAMLLQAVHGISDEELIGFLNKKGDWPDFFENAEVRKLQVANVPRDESGHLNLHRPYVDEVTFQCKKCKGEMHRVKEVADVWFDSGAMPFAQIHYPFENEEAIKKKKFFPADYISEAVDQTRGWFYTLLATSVLLGFESPYKNVISLGLVNDKNGQKMSKSKGNVINPWDMAEKFGMDVVRWYFYSATPPGEPKNFDETEIQKTFRRFHLILFNSLVFWKTYRSPKIKPSAPKNILDKWILARLSETISGVTENLDSYEVRGASIKIESFVDDLSRWFIRRSRRRFQPERGSGSKGDHEAASYILEVALSEITKLIAPFSPFFAEAMYQELGKEESVHLDNWPKLAGKADKKLIANMESVRRLASSALAKRAELGIKVRQPLKSLTVKTKDLAKNSDLADLREILKEEVNVKEILWDPKLEGELALDTVITPDLKEEGDKREFVRLIQGLRQEAGYSPKDKIELFIETTTPLEEVLSKFEAELKTEVGAKKIEFKRTDKFDAEIQSKFEDRDIWVGIKKI